MPFGFVQLMLDNTVRDIKSQFECDLLAIFISKTQGKAARLIGRISL